MHLHKAAYLSTPMLIILNTRLISLKVNLERIKTVQLMKIKYLNLATDLPAGFYGNAPLTGFCYQLRGANNSSVLQPTSTRIAAAKAPRHRPRHRPLT